MIHMILRRMRMPRPQLNYTATWAVLFMVTGVVLSLSPEMAFMSAISPSSSFAVRACERQLKVGCMRMPLDLPGEALCLPAHFFTQRTHLDFFVPPIFAAIIVVASICIIEAMAL